MGGPARCCMMMKSRMALAHGSFRRTGDATLPISGWGGAHCREPGPEPRAGPACSLGLLPQGLRAPLQDRVLLPLLATPRERAPRGTELSKDIAELAASVKNKRGTYLLPLSRWNAPSPLSHPGEGDLSRLRRPLDYPSRWRLILHGALPELSCPPDAAQPPLAPGTGKGHAQPVSASQLRPRVLFSGFTRCWTKLRISRVRRCGSSTSASRPCRQARSKRAGSWCRAARSAV
jgi:hypothetical protein